MDTVTMPAPQIISRPLPKNRIKVATLTAVMVTVNCPYCKEDTTDPEYGSYHWEVDYRDTDPGREHDCDECGQTFKIPARIKSRKL